MIRLLALLLLCMSLPSWAINKCIDASGKVTFTDAPCKLGQGKSTMEFGSAPTMPDPKGSSESSGTPSPKTATKPSADEMNAAWLKDVDRDRKRADLQSKIDSLQRDSDTDQRSMDAELAALQMKKLNARNNLAGATYEQSISQEMSAITSKYDVKIRSAQVQIDSLQTKLDAIK